MDSAGNIDVIRLVLEITRILKSRLTFIIFFLPKTGYICLTDFGLAKKIMSQS